MRAWYVARVAASALLVLALTDVAVRGAFPVRQRLAEHFSATYLRLAFSRLQASAPAPLALGDSVLWGYGVTAPQSAVALLRTPDTRWVNLAYQGGSPANEYATLRALDRAGARPRAVLFDVNLKTFNPSDSSYRTLAPAVEEAAWPALDPDARARLVRALAESRDARLERAVASAWTLYGMRDDERDALFDAPDAASRVRDAFASFTGGRERPADDPRDPDRYLGTYDARPLDDANVSVYFLRRFARELHLRKVPATAVLTPTNHALLAEAIDSRAYAAQLAYVRALLEREGVRVLDYDAAFSSEEFIDNDHLTVAGNRHLARLLNAALGGGASS